MPATSTTLSPSTGRQLAAASSAQVALLAALAAGVDLGIVGWLTGLAFAIGLHHLLARAARRAGVATLGPADLVTLGRAVLVGGVAALVADGLVGAAPPSAILIVIAVVALALDAVDGKVARRTGTVSSLGARFDMEVDAFLVLVLSVHVATLVGPWALAIGAMRYVFVVASWLLPWLRANLPTRYDAKAIAAVQGIVLLVASSQLLTAANTVALVGGALAALGWSFGRSVVWLWRHARA